MSKMESGNTTVHRLWLWVKEGIYYLGLAIEAAVVLGATAGLMWGVTEIHDQSEAQDVLKNLAVLFLLLLPASLIYFGVLLFRWRHGHRSRWRKLILSVHLVNLGLMFGIGLSRRFLPEPKPACTAFAMERFYLQHEQQMHQFVALVRSSLTADSCYVNYREQYGKMQKLEYVWADKEHIDSLEDAGQNLGTISRAKMQQIVAQMHQIGIQGFEIDNFSGCATLIYGYHAYSPYYFEFSRSNTVSEEDKDRDYYIQYNDSVAFVGHLAYFHAARFPDYAQFMRHLAQERQRKGAEVK